MENQNNHTPAVPQNEKPASSPVVLYSADTTAKEPHPHHHAKPAKQESLVRTLFSLAFWFSLFFAVIFIVSNYSAFLSIGSYYISSWRGETSSQENYLNRKAEEQQAKLDTEAELLKNASAQEIASRLPTLSFEITPPDNRLIIPKISKNVPILEVDPKLLENRQWEDLENQIQDVLHDGIVHYPHTAKPYQKGNMFITGHSSYYAWDDGGYKDVFALLSVLEVDDTFTIYYEGKRYDYVVTEKQVVKPDEVEVLRQKNGYTVSVMTCYPTGTNLRRLVVTGTRVEN